MRNNLSDNLKNILALDTAMNGCGVCVHKVKSDESFFAVQPMPRGQSEYLMPMIGKVMDQSGIGYEDLDAIVTTVGPGAFTGLRIGLSASKALGLALDIPVSGITTLQVLAFQSIKLHKDVPRLVVLIETKREDFYYQVFGFEGQPLSDPAAGNAQDIQKKVMDQPCLFAGDAVARFRSALSRADTQGHVFDETIILPDPALMAGIFGRGEKSAAFSSDLRPVYLRDPDVSLPKSAIKAK